MLEIIVERWSSASGREDFLWSVWRDGKRIEMGGPHEDADSAEAEARAVFRARHDGAIDRVSRL